MTLYYVDTEYAFHNTVNKIQSICEIEVSKQERHQYVIVTEIPDNPGMSICNAFEDLFKSVVKQFKLDPENLIWVERWPKWTRLEGGYDQDEERWARVHHRNGYNPHWKYIGANREEAEQNWTN